MSTDCTTPGLFYDKPSNEVDFDQDEGKVRSLPKAETMNDAMRSAENFVRINHIL